MARQPVTGTYQGHAARIWRGAIPGTHEPGFVESEIVEDERGSTVMQRALGVEAHVFRMGECTIILGREPGGVHGEERWHLTISCPDRHPSWDEIKTARYRLLGPDVVMAMVLPQPRFYVNVPEQDHVMQLWEIDDDARFWESM
jgi:hypothetical protein